MPTVEEKEQNTYSVVLKAWSDVEVKAEDEEEALLKAERKGSRGIVDWNAEDCTLIEEGETVERRPGEEDRPKNEATLDRYNSVEGAKGEA